MILIIVSKYAIKYEFEALNNFILEVRLNILFKSNLL